MLYILSHDTFLFNGLNRMLNNYRAVQLNQIKELRQIKDNTVIIDSLCYPGKIQHCLLVLTGIPVKNIIFLCSFRMGNINYPHKINYIPRKIKIDSFITESDKITNINVNITLPELTLTELIMIRYYIRNHTDETIAKKLNISLTTLRFHKYQVMLKLKLKRMHHIIYTEHYNYIMG
ncbi:hypothetical protein AIC87_003921 [Salmonella enterica subsp. enterica serovar Javiana]|nr:hypothetical protein [Salmonella enterica]EGZ4032487.1 hypothetical protein [Salmonella enterica subsp. enterica serovar Javiana]